jgi:hypothetical protein
MLIFWLAQAWSEIRRLTEFKTPPGPTCGCHSSRRAEGLGPCRTGRRQSAASPFRPVPAQLGLAIGPPGRGCGTIS